MSYCVALRLNSGLVFMADTRTNAGVDNVSRYPKIHKWSVQGELQIYLLTAGNLATSQAVISHLQERGKASDDRKSDIFQVTSLFQAARLVGETLREVIAEMKDGGQEAANKFDATLILGGQINGGNMSLYLIYPEGNFIEVSDDQPFFQIGETKYGKPILVRAFDERLSFSEAIKLLVVSFDSTIKANVSVGMPLDLCVYEKDSLASGHSQRLDEDNAYFQKISGLWGAKLKDAFRNLPDFQLSKTPRD
ncbi:MAG: peptidase [Pseudomonadota bacterium]|nr:peptidase [Pseudomonadota bacterium]